MMGGVREVLGNGTFLGVRLFGPNFEPWVVMILPPGGFLTLGLPAAGSQLVGERARRRAATPEAEAAQPGGPPDGRPRLDPALAPWSSTTSRWPCFLGLCPFMGVSAQVETALRMGLANIFVLIITSICAWFLNTYVLPHAPYLRLISFIVVIASLVQIVEMVIKKLSPTLFRELGIFLPLITTNCAILGLAIFQTNRGYGFMEGLFFALGAGLGPDARARADGLDPRGDRAVPTSRASPGAWRSS